MSKFQEFEAKLASNAPLSVLLDDLEKIKADLIANSPGGVAKALGYDTVSLAGSSLSTAVAVPKTVSLGK